MASVYNKVIEYKNYKFNIKVELNNQMEKIPDGKVWHTVTVNDMGHSNYYKHQLVLSDDLPSYIKLAIEAIKQYVDKPLNLSPDEQMLIDLGFK